MNLADVLLRCKPGRAPSIEVDDRGSGGWDRVNNNSFSTVIEIMFKASADGIAGIVTVPFGGTTKSFNGGEGSQCIGSVGVRFSY